jgi:hypothetical protein
MREAFPPEQSHERVSKRLQSFIERFERAFATDRIAQKHDSKVDEVIMAKSTSCKAHALLNSR